MSAGFRNRTTAGLVASITFAIQLVAGHPAIADGADQVLQLAVIINDRPSNMIAEFIELADGRIGARASELTDIGLAVDPAAPPGRLVLLEDLRPLKYTYDMASQTISIAVGADGLKPQLIDLPGAQTEADGAPSQAPLSAVLNYDLNVASGDLLRLRPSETVSASLSLDGRVFSPLGQVEQTAAISGITSGGLPQMRRLDSVYRYDDPARLITYRAGDAITGGLDWTRQIRIAGVQAQSNFGLRPDLVTTPMLGLRGTALVPSSLQVTVNGSNIVTQDIQPGPFEVNNVPVDSGMGNVTLRLTDADHHAYEHSVPYFSSPQLLRPGFQDWSAEVGFPRVSFGGPDDHYLVVPIATATYRRGLFDWATIEAHAELTAGVANGGMGMLLRMGSVGVANLAFAASHGELGDGTLAYASFESSLFGASLSGSYSRAFGGYDDLAFATARSSGEADAGGLAGPTRELGRLTLSLPLRETGTGIGLNFTRAVGFGGAVSETAGLFFNQVLPFGAALSASAYYAIQPQPKLGAFFSLNKGLGSDVAASSASSVSQGGTTFATDLVKSLGPEPGSVGWRVETQQGANATQAAAASVHTDLGFAELSTSLNASGLNSGFHLRGGLAAMSGNVFFSDWIDDAFAVVQTGLPGVTILDENVVVGRTNADGRLLLPTLRSHQANKISIDPTDLPADVGVLDPTMLTKPGAPGGVIVDLGVNRTTTSALVTFVRPNGLEIAPGSPGQTRSGQPFTVGYDGQSFIGELQVHNDVSIDLGGTTCAATFDFTPRSGTQQHIGPVECVDVNPS